MVITLASRLGREGSPCRGRNRHQAILAPSPTQPPRRQLRPLLLGDGDGNRYGFTASSDQEPRCIVPVLACYPKWFLMGP